MQHRTGMWMTMVKRTLLFGALVGCLTTGPSALAAQGGRVTGAGTRILGDRLARLSVDAVKRSDGSVSGQFQQHDPDNEKQFVHGEVTCLDFIDDHTALVSGFLTQTNNVPPEASYIVPGAPFIIYIQDNGNGASGAADRVSYYLVGDVGFPFPCGDEEFISGVVQFFQENPYVAPIIAGNFQVSR